MPYSISAVWKNFYNPLKNKTVHAYFFMLPPFLKKYFWDINFDSLDPDRSKTFVIERLLEYGDEQALEFLRQHYTYDDLAGVLRTSKSLSRRSAFFWSNILHISDKEIICLSKQFQETSRAIWRS